MAIEILEGPNNQPIAAKANQAGAQKVEVTGSALPDGAATATKQDEAKQELEEINAAATLLSQCVQQSPPINPFFGVNVRIGQSVTLPVEVVSSQTAFATPAADAQGIVVRLAGITSDLVGETSRGLDVGAWQKGPWPVDQGAPAGIDKPWPAILSDGVEQTGTERSPLIAAIPAYGRTSFGQVRVAGQEVLFDDVSDYELDLRAWSKREVGGGSVDYDSTSGLTALSVTSASGDVAEIATHTFFPYQPGSETHMVMTLKHDDAGQADQVREWGFGTQDDVYMFRLSGAALQLVVRSSSSGTPTDTHVIDQVDWNFDPMLDGTGPSKRTLDLTMINQWEIDFQWLSAGLIRFFINGSVVHNLDLRGNTLLPSTRSGQLPLRLTVTNTGASAASAMHYKCSVVYHEGGIVIKFKPGSHSLTASHTGIGTTHTAFLAFKLAATYLGRPMRKIILPRRADVSNASGRGTVRLYFNPTSITVVGAWTPVSKMPWLEYHENITGFVATEPHDAEIFLPDTTDVGSFAGDDIFALHGTHMRRNYDNTDGDVLLLTAAATLGNIDIVSALATFLTLG